MNLKNLKRIRKDRKGQAALEYLMTYGWAIIVIMVVGLVLWQMGIFTPDATPPGCNGFSQIVPLDSKFDSASKELKVVISNDAGTKLHLNNINATYMSTEKIVSINDDMRPGISRMVDFDFSAATVNSGDYYRINMIIDYTNALSGITHRSSGYCWGTIE